MCVACLSQNGVTAVDIARVFGWDKIKDELAQYTAKQTTPQELTTSQGQSEPPAGHTLSQVYTGSINVCLTAITF